jgi:hypothetical protein
MIFMILLNEDEIGILREMPSGTSLLRPSNQLPTTKTGVGDPLLSQVRAVSWK